MSTSRLYPKSDFLLVKQMEVDNKSAGGILLPGKEDGENFVKGKILRVGPGRMTDTGTLLKCRNVEGSTILYAKHSGVKIKDGIEEYTLMKDTDVLCEWIEAESGSDEG